MLKLMVIIGTRPEAIKLAPVIWGAEKRKSEIDCRVVLTGQHRGLLDSMLDILSIHPICNLDIMKERQTLTSMSCLILSKIEAVLEAEKPDWVVVQGDTTTAMVSSLAAFYKCIKVAHVEAGLRTLNKNLPFPEEMNRRLISQMADLHFPPTKTAYDVLISEGVLKSRVFEVGNTVIDCLLTMSKKLDESIPSSVLSLKGRIRFSKFILMTCHRRESFGEPLREICKAVLDILEACPDYGVVFPVHPNPEVRNIVYADLADHPRVLLIDPVGYLEFVWLMKTASLILSDSGGVAEEAPALGAPLIILRDVTERMESVHCGSAVLGGTNRESIVAAALKILKNDSLLRQMSQSQYPYGDGHSAEKILSRILDYHE